MNIIKLFFVFSILLCNSVFAAGQQIEIKTNLGNILLEIYPEKAPKTVNNFLGYIKEKQYEDTIFHRVIPGFMIQGGGFDKAMKKKPTRQPIENEADNGLKNEIGTIAMARTGDPHSATSQFFINVKNNVFLNHTEPTQRGYGYTVFGKVINGMDVVNRISEAPTGRRDAPKEMIVIKSISTIESVSEEINPVK
ncbi:MAG: peptidylprolyl isomerase [Nitrosomonadaceae bacterium]|jgi:peptidyl-prolyl cis-trans isomerase A (cyclophilin A)/peptidyl-prolyl cis-trans isomerase B (cyclophilin B)|nr:peptidylprolyl isomerase [Nitrosomonadaceae bacterium]|tara:strand:+ start:49 stop:630 length:582 start_codon:yes stop_codon:yes gene_type:complete